MIAPEGLAYVALAAVLFFFAAFLALWRKWKRLLPVAGLLLILWMAMMLFFRDPVRPLPDPGAWVAPSDGRVLLVDRREDGRRHFAVFLSLFNVHAVRAPATGTVLSAEHVPGRFHRADLPEAGLENEHLRLVFSTERGPLELRLIAGKVARRIVCDLVPGDSVVSGQRIGFIRFGSRAELTLPPGMECPLRAGDKVTGGVTTIGRTAEDRSGE